MARERSNVRTDEKLKFFSKVRGLLDGFDGRRRWVVGLAISMKWLLFPTFDEETFPVILNRDERREKKTKEKRKNWKFSAFQPVSA